MSKLGFLREGKTSASFQDSAKRPNSKERLTNLVRTGSKCPATEQQPTLGLGQADMIFLAALSMSMRTWSCVRVLKLVSRPSTYALCSSARGGDWDCVDRSAWDQFIFSIFWAKKLPKSLASWSGLSGGKETSLASHNKALVIWNSFLWLEPFCWTWLI